MPLRIYFFGIILLLTQALEAQHLRQFDLCDSTTYVLNADTSIVVSKQRLYAASANDLDLIYQFDLPSPDYYIRDFDIVKPQLWYTLIGDKTISDLTFLYKSVDRGKNWAIDTTYFTAIDGSIKATTFDPFDPNYYNSINQVQKLGNDTILLFLGYYGSGIVYSIDGGEHWTHWFANAPAHYFGLFECEQSYYLYQLEGDGFQGRMFPFDKQFLFRNDSLVNFDHLPSGSGHHPPFHLTDLPQVRYYSNLSNCEVYTLLSDYIDSTCYGLTSVSTFSLDQQLNIYPNPSDGQLHLELKTSSASPVHLTIYNDTGQKVLEQTFSNAQDLSHFQSYPTLPPGIYFFLIQHQEQHLSRKVLVH